MQASTKSSSRTMDSKRRCRYDDLISRKRPPETMEHRLDEHRQVREILNKLPDAGLKDFTFPTMPTLRDRELRKVRGEVILDCDRLRL